MEESSSNATMHNYTTTTIPSSTTTLLSNISTTTTTASSTSTTLELTTAAVHLYNETTETTTQTHIENVTQLLNLTKASEILLKPATTVTTSSSLCTTTVATTTTEESFDEFGPPEGVEYIFVPLGVMIFVIILSAVVIIISRKRKMERLRHRLMPLYNFDPGEEGEDDWETELLDEGFTSRQRRQGYQSMEMEENQDLFSNTDADSRIMF